MIKNLDLSFVADKKCGDAWKSYNAGTYDDALSLFQFHLDAGFKKEAYFGIGKVYFAQGHILKAVQNLMKAIKEDHHYDEAYEALGDIYSSTGQLFQAIESYAFAVSHNPENEQYKQKLVYKMSGVVIKKSSDNVMNALTTALELDDIDTGNLYLAWLSLIRSYPTFSPYYALSKYKDYKSFKDGLNALPHLNGLIDPLFLTGLGKFIVADIDFERWFVFLRRYMLEAVSEGTEIFSDPSDIDLITCALLKYCEFTDYIFNVSNDEKKLVEALNDKIETKANDVSLAELACFGCYEPLFFLKNAKEIAQKLEGGEHVSQIPKIQILDYFEQQEIKKTIHVFTEIDDKISKAVKEQYEEFPYPRWRSCAKIMASQEIEGHLIGRKTRILIAGCGTGKEAAEMAYAFPDAQITAVDLSLTSLAYAIHRTQKLGINNIKFMQADIMKLDKIEERFDYISSAGVLHHMDDPMAGWKVLTGLLKPKGLMRIALYSEHARWAINVARNFIEENKIGSDSESIRAFRGSITNYLKYKEIKNIQFFFDYYTLTECKDLLFHVNEHQFNLLQIKTILDDSNLEFLKFHISDKIIKDYLIKNKNDPGAIDLLSWNKYEEKNKDIFSSMYNFWCRLA
tara:strand:+ start:728 stop:2605 length:1878 start_codon:yes stop_codon:yes gene_type:complete